MQVASPGIAASPNGGLQMESWMPDWSLSTQFSSDHHKRAVSVCMDPAFRLGKADTIHWCLPGAVHNTESGYRYLKVTARLLRRGQSLCDE